MDDRSSLLTSTPRPRPARPVRSTFARFLRIAVPCTLAYVTLALAIDALFGLDDELRWRHRCHRWHGDRYCRDSRNDHGGRWHDSGAREDGGGNAGDDLTDLEKILLDTPSTEKLEEWSRYYTSGAHLAGQNYSQAEWTTNKWNEWGVNASIATYDCWLNRPVSHSLALLSSSGDPSSPDWKVEFRASLEEDVLAEDPTTGAADRIPTFHGYSASGNVTAPFVWVNYATYRDFEDLLAANVSLAGKIAIARYNLIFRGLKVKRAQELGMVGMVMYSDPGDDGDVTEENGYAPYPHGPARNPSSVQRGSVSSMSTITGDPTTPGYPSKPGVPRRDPYEAGYVPSIPSLPVSYAEAVPFLEALNGHGPRASDLGPFWTRNLGLRHRGVEYYAGPSPDNVVIHLGNEQNYAITPLWDVVGVINGTGPADEVVVVGNHRDAWIVGGAGDPNSGSAVLNEVVRSFGRAVRGGWRPHRTIVFGSWDGEEYILLGSTEWVEEHAPWLAGANVAYVNLDVAAVGTALEVSSSPLLHGVVHRALAKVPSPNQTVVGQTVHDVWDKEIGVLGSGSDFTAFLDFVGIPSVDFSFMETGKGAVYHYHSNYDSFHWMKTFADQDFAYHRAAARIFGLMAADLAESNVIPFSAGTYARALDGHLDQMYVRLDAATDSDSVSPLNVAAADDATITDLRARAPSSAPSGSRDALRGYLDIVRGAIADMRRAGEDFDRAAQEAERRRLRRGVSWWRPWEHPRLRRSVGRTNAAYKLLERDFLYEDGLDGRPLFKHVVYSPGLWSGYSGAVFPGLTESIDSEDYENGIKWAKIICECIRKATRRLQS